MQITTWGAAVMGDTGSDRKSGPARADVREQGDVFGCCSRVQYFAGPAGHTAVWRIICPISGRVIFLAGAERFFSLSEASAHAQQITEVRS